MGRPDRESEALSMLQSWAQLGTPDPPKRASPETLWLAHFVTDPCEAVLGTLRPTVPHHYGAAQTRLSLVR